MEYTDGEKSIARDIVSNPAMMDLLKKVLIEPQEQITPEMVVVKTNEELGEFVKADVLAQQKIKHRFGELQRLGIAKSTGSSPVAPR